MEADFKASTQEMRGFISEVRGERLKIHKERSYPGLSQVIPYRGAELRLSRAQLLLRLGVDRNISISGRWVYA